MANDDTSDPRCNVDALVVRARTDHEAFGQLYDLYYDRIHRYCARRTFRGCAAEEACSEVFLYAATHLQRFRGATEREFRGWLYGIATNTINAHFRRTRRRDELMKLAVETDALRASSAQNTDNSDFDPLDFPRLHQSIAQLNEREHAIVTLRYFADLSHDEIAAALGLRPGTVRVALSRALEKLRRQLVPPDLPPKASRN
jgi:RNA polymerase sigma-70 factor (ECF subfamily)